MVTLPKDTNKRMGNKRTNQISNIKNQNQAQRPKPKIKNVFEL